MPGWVLLSWAPCSRLKAVWNAAHCKGQCFTAPQQTAVGCSVPAKASGKEGSAMSEHKHTLSLRSYFCKNDEQTKAGASTNCWTNSVCQSMLNIMWYAFKSCLQLKYSVGFFFSLPTENTVYCYLNSIYFCNSLLMQSCFSLGPWI